ncbi:hypothetical protein EDF56_104579 [Novosphingobium sp. PhB165]|nr:hypothetical protein EDF56_104579 [Novosphingobium sp. PhB165]
MQMFPQAVRCLLNRHEPVRHDAKWDISGHYLSTCASCGTSIKRLRKGVWRRDEAHPH